MAKICTDINQSKKLIELGIDVNTADMWYQHIGYSITDGKEKLTYFPIVIRDNISDDDIPAWSLSALLKLIPIPILSTINNRFCCETCEFSSKYYDEPVDAAFEMICWLKENNKLINMSYKYFPNEFSSYEDYIKYLKEKGLALEVPERKCIKRTNNDI
jgi:hypothetical protein